MNEYWVAFGKTPLALAAACVYECCRPRINTAVFGSIYLSSLIKLKLKLLNSKFNPNKTKQTQTHNKTPGVYRQAAWKKSETKCRLKTLSCAKHFEVKSGRRQFRIHPSLWGQPPYFERMQWVCACVCVFGWLNTQKANHQQQQPRKKVQNSTKRNFWKKSYNSM